MRMHKLKLIILLLSLGIISGQQEFEKVGTSGAHFLDISPDARVVGMGNSVVGMKINDVSAVFYNPASLVHMSRVDFFFARVNWFAGIEYNGLAAGFRTPVGNMAFHVRHLTTGQIEETTVAEQEGTGRSYVWDNLALGISWAKSLTDKFAFGANISLVTEAVDMYDYKASAWAVDIGTLYLTGFRTLKLGMFVRNFGPELDFMKNGKDATFDDYHNGEFLPEPESFRPYHMPLTFQVGIAYDFWDSSPLHKLTVAVDAVHPNDSAERLNLGAQYSFMNILFLRSGLYSNHNSASVMGGFGINLSEFTPIGRSFRFDASLADFGLLGFVKQFTIEIGL